MTAIKRATLEALLLAARNTYPDEFLALLGIRRKNSKVIDEYVLLPSTYGKTFSSVRLDLLPYNAGTIGSVHSHPSYSPRPSSGDLRAFKSMGKIHLIIAKPFNFGSVKAFDSKGQSVELEVVE